LLRQLRIPVMMKGPSAGGTSRMRWLLSFITDDSMSSAAPKGMRCLEFMFTEHSAAKHGNCATGGHHSTIGPSEPRTSYRHQKWQLVGCQNHGVHKTRSSIVVRRCFGTIKFSGFIVCRAMSGTVNPWLGALLLSTRTSGMLF